MTRQATATTATLRSVIVVDRAPFSASNALSATTSLRSFGGEIERRGEGTGGERKKGPQEPISAEFGFGVGSFGQMARAVCVAASKAAVQIKCLYRARDRDRPTVVAQDRISARETANAFTLFAAEASPSVRVRPPLRLSSVHLRHLLSHRPRPCASSAISQYLFYTPNVLQMEGQAPLCSIGYL